MLTLGVAWSGLSFAQVQKNGAETAGHTSTANSQLRPVIAMDANSNYVIAWESAGTDGDGYGVYAQRYASNGAKRGTEFLVNTTTANDQRFPAASMDADGDFVIVWMDDSKDGDGWGIYGQRYDSAGATQGVEFKINTTTAGQQREPSVSSDSTGNFVATWMDISGTTFSIQAQRYNSSGVAQGSEFQVNTSAAPYHGYSDIASDDDGNFVISWQSDSLDGSGHGIYAQRYDNGGTAQGSEFVVNDDATNNQTEPSISIDATGRFVVVWTDDGKDTDEEGVYGQRFKANGDTSGTQFHVSTTTAGAQLHPSVSSADGGAYIVTWSGFGQDGSFAGTYLQAYNEDGDKIDGEEAVNTRTTDFQHLSDVAISQYCDQWVVTWQDGLNSSALTHDGDDYGVYFQRMRHQSPDSLTLAANRDTICSTDTTILVLDKVPSGAEVLWSPTTNLDDSTSTTPMLTLTSDTITYSVTVNDGNKGCDTTLAITVATVDSVFWHGNIDTDWATRTNWSPKVIPTGKCIVYVRGTTLSPTQPIISAAGAAVKEIEIQSSDNANVTITGSGTLEIEN